jgi:hypothetical protein
MVPIQYFLPLHQQVAVKVDLQVVVMVPLAVQVVVVALMVVLTELVAHLPQIKVLLVEMVMAQQV